MANHKRGFEIVQIDKSVDGVEIGGQKMKFGKSGGFRIEDAAKAKDIDMEWGYSGRRHGRKDKVLVIPTDDKRVEPGHNYTFTTIALPYARYDEFGRRIRDEGDNDGSQERSREESDTETGGSEADPAS